MNSEAFRPTTPLDHDPGIKSSRRPIQVRFEGPQGSATIELPRTVVWRLTADVYDMTIRRKT